MRLLAEQLPDAYRPFVHLVFPQMPVEDLLAYLAAELGASAAKLESSNPWIDASVRRIQHRLAEIASQGKHAVVAIDKRN